MKYLIAFFLFSTALFACTGDCLTCHPALEKTIHTDERHKPMLSCIECHSSNPNAMAECGSDCFACHTIEKIERPGIKEHAVIRECRDCHMKMKEELFNMQMLPSQSKPETFDGFLMQ